MEEKITIERKMTGFCKVSDAIEFTRKYEKQYRKIPVNKWVRCSEVGNGNYHLIAKLFKMLCNCGLAEKRIVDDGIIYIEDEKWERVVVSEETEIPEFITAYDKNGNLIGEILNPEFTKLQNNRKPGEGRLVKYQRPIHASHSEFRLLP